MVLHSFVGATTFLCPYYAMVEFEKPTFICVSIIMLSLVLSQSASNTILALSKVPFEVLLSGPQRVVTWYDYILNQELYLQMLF